MSNDINDKATIESGAVTTQDLPPVEDLNVLRTASLVSPRQVKSDLPISPTTYKLIVESRDIIQNILTGADKRILVAIGPCSIHDEQAAYDYARRLAGLAREVGDKLYLVMRTYFEKPRTTIGWKGLISDPHLDGSSDIEAGLRKAREIMLHVTELGLPTATEMLDPITPQYIADLVSWAAIGARTTESQTHRQMASGLSMPVGFKNSTAGDLSIALDAMQSALHPHSFLGIDEYGRSAIIHTRGNKYIHLILRGGGGSPNYDAQSVDEAVNALRKRKLPEGIMVDTSHANSNKQYQNQHIAFRDVIEQRCAGNMALTGLMVESNICEGSQKFPQPKDALTYGVSITDPCIGWEETENLLRWAHGRLP